MPCGKQYCDGTPPAPPFFMSARLASKTAWYSAVNGGVPAGVQFGTPTRSHCPFRSGYLDSSSMRALAEAISAVVSATAANRRKSYIDVTSQCAADSGPPRLFVVGSTSSRSSLPEPYTTCMRTRMDRQLRPLTRAPRKWPVTRALEAHDRTRQPLPQARPQGLGAARHQHRLCGARPPPPAAQERCGHRHVGAVRAVPDREWRYRLAQISLPPLSRTQGRDRGRRSDPAVARPALEHRARVD